MSGCADSSAWWSAPSGGYFDNRPWNDRCNAGGAAAFLIVAGGAIVVATVIGGGLTIVTDIRNWWRDGTGGVPYDSPEGLRLRMLPRSSLPAPPQNSNTSSIDGR